VRIQIVQSLASRSLTTQEIANSLPSIPQSSIYRHVKRLLDGGVLEVAETRPIKGIQEKVYRLAQSPRLTQEDLAEFTHEDHIRYFTAYVATLLQAFSDYIEGSLELDFVADRTGYTEVTFYASGAEFDTLQRAINQALLPLMQNEPGAGRQKRKLAIVTHLLSEKSEEG
jgi:hypothetical protein